MNLSKTNLGYPIMIRDDNESYAVMFLSLRTQSIFRDNRWLFLATMPSHLDLKQCDPNGELYYFISVRIL